MRLWRITILVSGLWLLAVPSALRAEITVFTEGRVRLPVIVAADAGPEERAAAAELARVLGAMSGLDWPVRTEREEGRGGPHRGDEVGRPKSAGNRAGVGRTESAGDRAGAGFYVGHTRAAARWFAPLRPAADLLRPKADEIGPDGFRICTQGEQVFIEGATPEATGFAVSWLLQREGGVRWYAPGPLGEVIPRRTGWTLPELRVVREPAYVSREISGVDATWARRNGLRQRLEYSHNLVRVFPPDLAAAHPEWFPLVQGQRVLPAAKADFNWQPDLAQSAVAEWAAQQAAEAFAREPGRASFSLGMNDSVRFDQGPATRAVVEPLPYFRGMPDYSPLVFGFMNRAAEALGQAHPDKYLGCLAYFWCENTPAFAVNPQVVPYVTTDRTQFYDPAYRAADYALMSRWGRSGVRAFGLWEYAEGDAFVVPRVPHAMLAEAVREGWWRGARGYMGECGPHQGFDAFKVWMLAQLLWEPERTLAELEDDFFNGWYGPAAEPMRRFFARCEAQWLAQEGPPWWIKYYRQQDQVLLFPPEVCRELRALLVAAEAAAKGQGPRDGAEGGRRKAEGGEVAGTKEQVTSGEKSQTPKGQCAKEDGANDQCLMPNDQGRSGAASPNSSGRVRQEVHPSVPIRVIRGGRSEVVGSGPETRNAKPETLYSARVALTSRAFAVTEAAVEFGRWRSALAAAPETITAADLAPLLQQLQRARVALERAAQEAAKADGGGAESAGDRAGLPAMATGEVAYLLRNDPVPRLLAALGGRDPSAPMDALSGLLIAGEPVPVHWGDLAAAFADGNFAQLKNRLVNGDFSRVAAARMEPEFLYPRWGGVPADWTVRGIATETGRVALVPAGCVPISGVPTSAAYPLERSLGTPRGTQPAGGGSRLSLASTDVEAGEAGRGPVGPRPGRTLRIEGAWETQLSTTLPATPGRLQVVSARMRGRSSPGADAALFLVFVTADGRSTGEYRTQTLPKGASEWRTQLLAATVPADAAWVSVGVAALRQPAGDWLEVAEVSLSAKP